MARHATLKIYSRGGIRAVDVAVLLTVTDDACNAICAYENFLDSVRRFERRGIPPFYLDMIGFPFHLQSRLRQLRDWPPTPDALRTLVSSRDRLIVRSVELHSPGFWEFLAT